MTAAKNLPPVSDFNLVCPKCGEFLHIESIGKVKKINDKVALAIDGEEPHCKNCGTNCYIRVHWSDLSIDISELS